MDVIYTCNEICTAGKMGDSMLHDGLELGLAGGENDVSELLLPYDVDWDNRVVTKDSAKEGTKTLQLPRKIYEEE